jgi:multidrug efflux pump subunit AcrA (membrane-fusion protein)
MTNSITKKFLAILFFVSPLFASDWSEANKNSEAQLFTVQVLDSEAFVIKDSIEFSSTTEAHQRIEVKSEIMTTVEEVLKKAGTFVNKNDLVIRLDEYNTNLELYKLDLLSESEFKKIALYAPFDGILLDSHKIAGELVMPGERVYELIDLSSLEIYGYINENEILDISTNNEVDVTILGEEVQGVIDYVSPISDPETKTFEIVVKVKNEDLRYKDGLSSMISINKGEVLAHKISPSILALGDEGQLGVKVITKGNEVEFKNITIIEDTSEYMLVTGLSKKEKIIIVGQQYVSNGEKVNFE